MTRLPRRPVGLLIAAVLLVAAALLPGCDRPGPGDAGPRPDPTGTLVLYDTTGEFGALGELYAAQTANLASHFGAWTARPVAGYTAGQLAGYAATIYLGSTFDEPLPAAFLDDVAAARTPVLWVAENIWQLTARHAGLGAARGFTVGDLDPKPVSTIRYRDVDLARDPKAANVRQIKITDPALATVVGTGQRPDGSTAPWGVRAANLTYLAELPLTYTGPNDRYLAFADLLFDLLAPTTPTRHRALVRLEDVSPQSNPGELRAIGDYLFSRKVPFSVAVIAEYHDPAGRHNGGRPVRKLLSQTPAVVAALKYLVSRGGTLIMHGFTHQYAAAANPYGVSGEDYEFFRAHRAADNGVVLDGPVPEDSAAWATDRLTAAHREWLAARLPRPTIFEFPHYTASAADYRAVSQTMGIRYEASLYFPGVLTGATVDHSRSTNQYFPYPVRDVYGALVIPETLGNVAPRAFNQHGVRSAADLVASARRQLVIRDGVASFFYHPFLGVGQLATVVEGIQGLGYTFVAPTAVLVGLPAA